MGIFALVIWFVARVYGRRLPSRQAILLNEGFLEMLAIHAAIPVHPHASGRPSEHQELILRHETVTT